MTRTVIRAGALAAAAFLATGMGACSTTSVLSLHEGQCLMLPTGTNVTTVRTVDCSSPHEAEVFDVITVPEQHRPGDADLDARAREECRTTFDTWVGRPFEESDLEYSWIIPSERSWQQGDRDVVCYVHTLDGARTTTPFRGSGR